MVRRSSKTINDSIKLAERVALVEKQFKGPQPKKRSKAGFIQKLYNSLQKDLKKNFLAQYFLPQARVRMEMKNARAMALEQTLLGAFQEAVLGQFAAAGGFAGELGISSSEFPRARFGTPIERKYWKDLVSSLEGGNKLKLLEALSAFLEWIKNDLAKTELPLAPVLYHIPSIVELSELRLLRKVGVLNEAFEVNPKFRKARGK